MRESLIEAGRLICGQVHPFAGGELPLCARCTGIYGAFLAGMLLAGAVSISKVAGRWRLRLPASFTARVLAAGVLLISIAPIHAIFFQESGDMARLATGAMTGAGIAMLLGRGAWPSLAAAALVIAVAALRISLVHEIVFWVTPVVVLMAWAIPIIYFVDVFKTTRSGEIRLPS